jgi:hypothetical protein
MKSIEFCYWLQGMFELQNPTTLDAKQTQTIKNHLAMVFHHDPQPSNFCAFMNGYLKIQNPEVIGESQTTAIKNQLNAIFDHVIEQKPKPPTNDKPRFEAMC